MASAPAGLPGDTDQSGIEVRAFLERLNLWFCGATSKNQQNRDLLIDCFNPKGFILDHDNNKLPCQELGLLHGIIATPVPIKNFRCRSTPMDLHLYTFWNDSVFGGTNSISTVCVKVPQRGNGLTSIQILMVNISYKEFKYTSSRAGDAFKLKNGETRFPHQMYEKCDDPNTQWADCWQREKEENEKLSALLEKMREEQEREAGEKLGVMIPNGYNGTRRGSEDDEPDEYEDDDEDSDQPRGMGTISGPPVAHTAGTYSRSPGGTIWAGDDELPEQPRRAMRQDSEDSDQPRSVAPSQARSWRQAESSPGGTLWGRDEDLQQKPKSLRRELSPGGTDWGRDDDLQQKSKSARVQGPDADRRQRQMSADVSDELPPTSRSLQRTESTDADRDVLRRVSGLGRGRDDDLPQKSRRAVGGPDDDLQQRTRSARCQGPNVHQVYSFEDGRRRWDETERAQKQMGAGGGPPLRIPSGLPTASNPGRTPTLAPPADLHDHEMQSDDDSDEDSDPDRSANAGPRPIRYASTPFDRDSLPTRQGPQRCPTIGPSEPMRVRTPPFHRASRRYTKRTPGATSSDGSRRNTSGVIRNDSRVPRILTNGQPRIGTFRPPLQTEMKVILKDLKLGLLDNLLDMIIDYAEPVQEWLEHNVPVLLGRISRWLKGDTKTTDENYESLISHYHRRYLMCGWGGPNWCWDYHEHYAKLKRVGGTIQSRNYTRDVKLIAKIDDTVIFTFIEYDVMFRPVDIFSHLCIAHWGSDEWFAFDHSTNLAQRIQQDEPESSSGGWRLNNFGVVDGGS